MQFCDLIIASVVKILGQLLKKKAINQVFAIASLLTPWTASCSLFHASQKQRKKKLRKMANLEIGDECASEGGEEAKAHGGSVHSSQPPVLLPRQRLHRLEPHVHGGKCCTGSGAAKDEGTGLRGWES